MPTIAACLVVKDEGETLQACLESIKESVDEIVIGVDDSCTDATPQIARAYASPGKLFEFTWDNDFSRVRNEAIKRAESDLIWIIDGHEFLPPDEHPVAEKLTRMRHVNVYENRTLTPRSFIEQIRQSDFPQPYEVICTTLAMNTDFWGIPQLFFLQPRIFRNNGRIHYANPVHNYLAGYDRSGAMGCPEGVLIHNMPEKREEKRKVQRKAMNISGLYADHKADPEDARPLFYLGNTHADLGNNEKAAHWYRRYLKKSQFGEERYQALQQLAIIESRHFKDFATAKQLVVEATQLQWNRKEPHILLGEIAFEQEEYDEAIHWWDLADQMPAPATVMFLQGAAYSYMTDLKRMTAWEAKGDIMNALQCADRVLSWRPGDPSIIEKIGELRTQVRRQAKGNGDKNMLIVDNQMAFTEDIASHFAGEHTVVRRQQCDERWKAWADLAWLEWCDQSLIELSQKEWDIPVVCRLHSYEAFGDMPAHVNWNNVDHLIFVADHIRAMFNEKFPEVQKVVEMSTIPNGIDPSKFPFKERGPGKTIGHLGYLNHKKGTDLLVQAMYALPDYEFKVAGKFQDPHLMQYFKDAIDEMHNVQFDGWIDPANREDWLNGVDYLISPSIVESFGYSIAEAMLMGIKPLVHHRSGAIWHETWRTTDDLRELLEGPYDSAAYRQHIEMFFPLDRQMAATETLVEYVTGQKHGRKPVLSRLDYEASPIIEHLEAGVAEHQQGDDVAKIVEGEEVHG